MINSITIIGTGNLAWHLANACKLSGVNVVHIAGKEIEKAKSLAIEFGIKSFSDLSAELPPSDMYIICVKDEAIKDTAQKIYRKGFRLVHTSGATASLVLNFGDAFGVFWPMQTLVKGAEINYNEMLVCITGSDNNFTSELSEFAKKISGRIEIVTDEQRAILHMCAVWVNNFTNHMFDIADRLLQEHNLQFDLMLPMIRDMMKKAGTTSPANLQTGPAKRGDTKTVENHLRLLEYHPELQKIYQLISDSIMNEFRKQ